MFSTRCDTLVLLWSVMFTEGNIGKCNGVKDVYSLIFLPPVGWSRTSSRLCRTTKRDPDAVAPINSQTLPHTALWVLKCRHAGRGGRRPAELGCRELEGMISSLPSKKKSEIMSTTLEDNRSPVLRNAILMKFLRMWEKD